MDANIDVFANQVTEQLRSRRRASVAAIQRLIQTRLRWRACLAQQLSATTRRFGADDPRAARLREMLRSDRRVVDELESQRERLRIEAPAVLTDDALVEGRVEDRRGRGIRGLTARLVRAQDRPVNGVADSITDGSGHFATVLDGPAIARVNEAGAVFLALFDESGERVHQDQEALTPAAGDRIFREITLNRRRIRDFPIPRRPVPPVNPPPPATPPADPLPIAPPGLTPPAPTPPPTPPAIPPGGPPILATPPAGGGVPVIGPILVPNVVGASPRDARATLERAGFAVDRALDDEDETGIVMRQDPPAGAERPAGSRVTLVMRRRGQPGGPASPGGLSG